MSHPLKFVFVSNDAGLLEHWQRVLRTDNAIIVRRFSDLLPLKLIPGTLVLIDLSVPDVPLWKDEPWRRLVHEQLGRVVAASSSPKDDEAIEALDAGCSAYCHAFSDAATLIQVTQVVQAGHVWIGKTLMQRLIQSAGRFALPAAVPVVDWREGLTPREREVAVLAANGASNHHISLDCNISERTVKAHLSSVFEKLNLTDRLQLALRVHGIH
jgi:DNA-binding NarL/FixJ family response regulator